MPHTGHLVLIQHDQIAFHRGIFVWILLYVVLNSPKNMLKRWMLVSSHWLRLIVSISDTQ